MANDSAVLQRVLSLVQSIDNKMNALSAEQESLKESLAEIAGHVRGIDSRLPEFEANCGVCMNENVTTILKVKSKKVDGCMTPECVETHKPRIKQVVEAFTVNENWNRLKTGLHDVLDHSSEVYEQLRSSESLYDVGCRGNTQLASLLFCAGLSLDTRSTAHDFNMLHGAAEGGHLQLVKLLTERGADVNARNINGWTPLMRAAGRGHLEVVKYLVQSGADINARGDSGRDAEYFAQTQGNSSELLDYINSLKPKFKNYRYRY